MPCCASPSPLLPIGPLCTFVAVQLPPACTPNSCIERTQARRQYMHINTHLSRQVRTRSFNSRSKVALLPALLQRQVSIIPRLPLLMRAQIDAGQCLPLSVRRSGKHRSALLCSTHREERLHGDQRSSVTSAFLQCQQCVTATAYAEKVQPRPTSASASSFPNRLQLLLRYITATRVTNSRIQW